jgi:hypothetical protein
MSRTLFFSFLFPLLALAQSSLPPAGNNGGDDNPPDPTDAGAAGSQKGAFTLSNGALAAIIVVVVIVVIGGSMLPLHEIDAYLANVLQLLPQLYGGSQRSDNGTFDSRSAAHHAVSLAAEIRTTSKTARNEELVSVSTRLLQERTPSQGKSTILRRVFLYQTKARRPRRLSPV